METEAASLRGLLEREAVCVNSLCPEQIAVATNRKGLVFVDLDLHDFYFSTRDNLWGRSNWPRNGWAGAVATPPPVFLPGAPQLSPVGGKAGKDFYAGGMGMGIPGYGGIGAWGLGWEDLEDVQEGYVDPPATVENVEGRALAPHPLRPLFLVGSNNTHVYLWEFGADSALATYGVLPAAGTPVPLVIPSVAAVKFDLFGQRFATAAADGTVSVWHVEVGGCSNIRPSETRQCFARSASDVAFVGASSTVVAAAGFAPTQDNVVLWDTLAPPASSRVALNCHEGGARSIAILDTSGGAHTSISNSLIVTGGKSGDIAVHDFRYIATGRAARHGRGADMSSPHAHGPTPPDTLPSPLQLSVRGREVHSAGGGGGSHGRSRSPTWAGMGGGNRTSGGGGDGNGGRGGHVGSGGDKTLWYIPRAHAGGVSKISPVPGTSLFLTGGKDGDVRLWDAATCQLLHQWTGAHERRTFLNARGFGAVMQLAVTDIVPRPDGIITCGADGLVKFWHMNEHRED